MNSFENVSKRLKTWTAQIRGTRGQGIADVTTETIKELCGNHYFDLPNLKNYIDDHKRREGTLQSILSDYRDHFIHPFHVFCLGYYILNQWRLNDNETMPLDIIGIDKKNLDLKKWFVTAIFHDVGYPAQKFEILVRDLFKTSVGRKISSHFDWSSVLLADENIKHIHVMSELFGDKAGDKNKVESFKIWFYKRLLEEHDHGALSALMLCNQKINDNIINEAALAIALHSWRRESNIIPSDEINLDKLAVEKFPLSFFLSFCDTAQEWGRGVLLYRVFLWNKPKR